MKEICDKNRLSPCDMQRICENRLFFNDFLLSYIHLMVLWKISPNFARSFYESFNLLCVFRCFLRRSF